MLIRLVVQKADAEKAIPGKEEDFSCSHIAKTLFDDRTEVELCPGGPTLVLRHPDVEGDRDGVMIYQMNDYGDTQDRIFPPKPKEERKEGRQT